MWLATESAGTSNCQRYLKSQAIEFGMDNQDIKGLPSRSTISLLNPQKGQRINKRPCPGPSGPGQSTKVYASPRSLLSLTRRYIDPVPTRGTDLYPLSREPRRTCGTTFDTSDWTIAPTIPYNEHKTRRRTSPKTYINTGS